MTSKELLEQIVDYYTMPCREFDEKHPITDFAMHPLRQDVHERLVNLLEQEHKADSEAS